jgi:hypothetical protein
MELALDREDPCLGGVELSCGSPRVTTFAIS